MSIDVQNIGHLFAYILVANEDDGQLLIFNCCSDRLISFYAVIVHRNNQTTGEYNRKERE